MVERPSRSSTPGKNLSCHARAPARSRLFGGELAEVAGKRGPTRLAFALLLKFYTRRGRFPRGRGELPDEAVAYVARQVKVPAFDLGLYECTA